MTQMHSKNAIGDGREKKYLSEQDTPYRTLIGIDVARLSQEYSDACVLYEQILIRLVSFGNNLAGVIVCVDKTNNENEAPEAPRNWLELIHVSLVSDMAKPLVRIQYCNQQFAEIISKLEVKLFGEAIP